MYYFMLNAAPQPGNERAAEAGGAYVNCWVNFALEVGAELLARHYVEQDGWKVSAVEERNWVEREQYEEDPETLAYYEEAEQDGISLAFYLWPKDAEDTDVEYKAASEAA